MLGLAGLPGGRNGHTAAPWPQNHAGAGWGFWESELQLTGSKCSQEGSAGVAVEPRWGSGE